jgi:flotillin
MLYRYIIADANEYLVITGAGIPDLRICKKALVMPWQRVGYICNPIHFPF